MDKDKTIRLNISTADKKSLADSAMKKIMNKKDAERKKEDFKEVKLNTKIFQDNRSGFLTSTEEKRRSDALARAALTKSQKNLEKNQQEIYSEKSETENKATDSIKDQEQSLANSKSDITKKKRDFNVEPKKKTSLKEKKIDKKNYNEEKIKYDDDKIKIKEFKKKKAKLENIEVDISSIYGDYTSDIPSTRTTRRRSRKKAKSHLTIQKNKVVNVHDGMRVQDLALGMAIKSVHLVNFFNNLGIKAKKDTKLSFDDAVAAVEEMGQIAKKIDSKSYDYLFCKDSCGEPRSRRPVVVVMGHIDHGKTTLLDALRNSSVTLQEHGGVTQHIGAYKVISTKGEMTIIDTPGHEAFSIMRERGISATDIVILVVAADDGVKPQTIEAINLIKNYNIPVIVAINKIDKEGANEQKAISELLNYGIIPESLGGDVVCISISAKKKQNLDSLIESVLLEADMLSLTQYPQGRCSGYIIESQFNKFKSNYATILVQNGSLNIGDFIVTKTCYCKVKSITNDMGEKIKSAHASDPVEINGFNGRPQAGSKFAAVKDESLAKSVIEYYKKNSEEQPQEPVHVLEDNFGEEEAQKLNIIIKSDTDGTSHSIAKTISSLETKDIEINIIKSDVGNISNADIGLAEISDAIIISFNSLPLTPSINSTIKQKGIKVFNAKVIYQIVDYIEEKIKSMTKKKIERTQTGSGVVKQVFSLSKIGQIVGCRIEDGIVKKDYLLEFYDKETKELIGSAKAMSIKHYSEECEQTTVGMDFGLNIGKALNVYPGCIMKSFIVKD